MAPASGRPVRAYILQMATSQLRSLSPEMECILGEAGVLEQTRLPPDCSTFRPRLLVLGGWARLKMVEEDSLTSLFPLLRGLLILENTLSSHFSSSKCVMRVT